MSVLTNAKRVEDRELCALCGGACCKRAGCDLLPTDRQVGVLSIPSIYARLSTGEISIVASAYLKVDGKMVFYWTMRMRGSKEPAINFFPRSEDGNVCNSLTSEGCRYELEARPLMAANMEVSPLGHGYCRGSIKYEDVARAWAPYQELLLKVILCHFGGEAGALREIERQRVPALHWAMAEDAMLKRIGNHRIDTIAQQVLRAVTDACRPNGINLLSVISDPDA